MYPRTEYEMTEASMLELLAAMKPVPMIMLQCGDPPSQQENANRAWNALGEKMGFDGSTVQPVCSKGSRFFTAVPNEPDDIKKTRLAHELEEKRQKQIMKLKEEIAYRQEQLEAISGEMK